MPRFQEGHALTIGVADYRDKALELPRPITVADARGVADALRDPAVAAYPPEQVGVLPDGATRVTQAEMIRALEEFAGRVGLGDTAFIFFCTHGVLGEDGEYYLTTQDTILTPGKLAKAGTGLSKTKLLDLLRAVKARKLLIIINACFSGHVGPSLAAPEPVLGAPPSLNLSVDLLGAGEGRALITASRPRQYSYFSLDHDISYFGQALIEGLRGGAQGSGGYIGLHELYQYVYTVVRSKTENSQDPMLTILEGVGPFPVALHKGGHLGALDPGAIQAAPPKGAAVEVVKRSLIEAMGRGARVFDIRAEGDVKVDQSRRLIDFGSGNQMGNVSFGDVAGGSITKITAPASRITAARADNMEAILETIRSINDDLGKLQLPSGAGDDRSDVSDDLEKALKAGREGKRTRMMERLESAQKVLLKIGTEAEDGIKLADTVGTLIQRLLGMG
jgi:hypothetical protein